MEQFRAVYLMVEGRFAEWLEQFWSGRAPKEDALYELFHPNDMSGEVRAWSGPHLTLLDALTTCVPDQYDTVVREVCRRHPAPTIRPIAVAVWPTPRIEAGHTLGGSSLVLRCASPELDGLQRDLVKTVRPLLCRSALADEEWQRAEWWVRQVSTTVEQDLRVLGQARAAYLTAGCPPLPSSRHFRLDRLVRLVRSLEDAPSAEHARRRHEALAHFLSCGEPPWALEPQRLHVSIATGVAGRPLALSLLERVESRARELFGELRPTRATIMEADESNPVTVRLSDALTRTEIDEVRPGLRVREWVPFA
jgi:hypothetical protein